jgi:hypothetical protein
MTGMNRIGWIFSADTIIFFFSTENESVKHVVLHKLEVHGT